MLRVRNGGSDVIVEVEDTGRGITPDDLERLGTSFFTTRTERHRPRRRARARRDRAARRHARVRQHRRPRHGRDDQAADRAAATELGGRAAMVEARA